MGWVMEFTSPYAVFKNGKMTMPTASRQKALDQMLTWEDKDEQGNVIASHRVLKSAMVGSTYYGAVTTEKGLKPSKIWAAIIPTCGRVAYQNTIWGHKDMDETMGPCYYDCPIGILDLLTPTDNDTALGWREECIKKRTEKAKTRKERDIPKFVPTGVTVSEERDGWVFNSKHFQKVCNYRYRGAKLKKRFHPKYESALYEFLRFYGTSSQKKEYADRGANCPEEWKKGAA